MVEIIRYEEKKHKEMWDNFVRSAKNGHLLAYRNYMDYHFVFHPNRFVDYSLMFFHKNKLVSVLPANLNNNILYSHSGLTFGGFITNESMSTPLMLQIFEELVKYLKHEGITEFVYKTIPHIYHILPSEEDLYALYRYNATLYRRDVTTSVLLAKRPKFKKNRRRSIKKAVINNVKVKETNDFRSYWKILEENLVSRHKTKPTHTIEEILYLKSMFPDKIRLFGAYYEDKLVAGVVIYETNSNVAHAQYISSSEIGKEVGALDLIFSYLINEYYSTIQPKNYFDFGISTEREGKYLNEGLILQKEGFGGRAVVHDFYKLRL